jgi:hypothetical protein
MKIQRGKYRFSLNLAAGLMLVVNGTLRLFYRWERTAVPHLVGPREPV